MNMTRFLSRMSEAMDMNYMRFNLSFFILLYKIHSRHFGVNIDSYLVTEAYAPAGINAP